MNWMKKIKIVLKVNISLHVFLIWVYVVEWMMK